MTIEEMSAFLKTIAEKMKPDFNMGEALNNFAVTLQVFAEAADKMKNNIDWTSVYRSLQTFADILARIPNEVKDTKLFHEVDKFAKYNDYELTYENINWFLEDIRNEVLIEGIGATDGAEDNTGATFYKTPTNLTDYIYRIKDNLNLSIREKVIILLAHMESLIFETLDHEKVPREKLKNTVREIAVHKNDGMSEESLAKVYVYGIHSIVFAPTDFFSYPIDKRIPFRNNILHNGVMDYPDEEMDSAYEVLSDFIDALVILKHWIPAKEEGNGEQ